MELNESTNRCESIFLWFGCWGVMSKTLKPAKTCGTLWKTVRDKELRESKEEKKKKVVPNPPEQRPLTL